MTRNHRLVVGTDLGVGKDQTVRHKVETPKAECLRRWASLQLTCSPGKTEGFVITNWRDTLIAEGHTAHGAWSACLATLSEMSSAEIFDL